MVHPYPGTSSRPPAPFHVALVLPIRLCHPNSVTPWTCISRMTCALHVQGRTSVRFDRETSAADQSVLARSGSLSFLLTDYRLSSEYRGHLPIRRPSICCCARIAGRALGKSCSALGKSCNMCSDLTTDRSGSAYFNFHPRTLALFTYSRNHVRRRLVFPRPGRWRCSNQSQPSKR